MRNLWYIYSGACLFSLAANLIINHFTLFICLCFWTYQTLRCKIIHLIFYFIEDKCSLGLIATALGSALFTMHLISAFALHVLTFIISFFTSTTHATGLPKEVEVIITASIYTVLQPRVDITIPPVVIPSITIKQFTFTKPKFSLSLNLPTPTCTQTISPDKNGWVPAGTCNSFWNYYPSFSAAVATAVVFGLITAVHVGQAIYFKNVGDLCNCSTTKYYILTWI